MYFLPWLIFAIYFTFILNYCVLISFPVSFLHSPSSLYPFCPSFFNIFVVWKLYIVLLFSRLVTLCFSIKADSPSSLLSSLSSRTVSNLALQSLFLSTHWTDFLKSMWNWYLQIFIILRPWFLYFSSNGFLSCIVRQKHIELKCHDFTGFITLHYFLNSVMAFPQLHCCYLVKYAI